MVRRPDRRPGERGRPSAPESASCPRPRPALAWSLMPFGARLLDRTLIWNERHLLHALREFESCNRACRCFVMVAGARAQPRPGTVNIGWPLDVGLTSSWSTSQCSAMRPSSTR